MRPKIHIKLTDAEQAEIAAWTHRVLAGSAFAGITLLVTVLFQNLFVQNSGSAARIGPPALAENASPAAPQ